MNENSVKVTEETTFDVQEELLSFLSPLLLELNKRLDRPLVRTFAQLVGLLSGLQANHEVVSIASRSNRSSFFRFECTVSKSTD